MGTMLAGGTVIATNTTTLYDVLINGIKIVVDGKELKPTDAQGNKVEPIIYNGTTYLPVRAVANAIGKAVYWDGPNYTVYLGDMGGDLEYPTVELEDMISINQSPTITNKLTDNYSNRYNRAICNDLNNNNLEYLLNMKYSKFKGTLYIPEGVSDDDLGYLRIIADGKTIYTSPEMTKASSPISIDISVVGYNDVKIEFSISQWKDSGLICLGNAGFYQ